MVNKNEPCSICEEYIDGVICNKDKCPVGIMKEENKRLKFRKCLYSGLYSEYDTKLRDCTQGECFYSVSEEAVRLEAIKEFWDRLKKEADFISGGDYGFSFEIREDVAEDIIKEMVGE